MILFGVAEVFTGLFLGYSIGVSAANNTVFALEGAAIGAVYIIGGFLLLTGQKWAAGLAELCRVDPCQGQMHTIGFRRSDKPLLSYRVSTFVDFLDGFLSELKIERASLVGNSLGGWVAAAFTLAHPERVERLVLSDAAGYAAVAKNIDPRALSALRLASRDDVRYLGPLTF
jgi:hypothetical protein